MNAADISGKGLSGLPVFSSFALMELINVSSYSNSPTIITDTFTKDQPTDLNDSWNFNIYVHGIFFRITAFYYYAGALSCQFTSGRLTLSTVFVRLNESYYLLGRSRSQWPLRLGVLIGAVTS